MSTMLIIALIALLIWKLGTIIRVIGALIIAILAQIAWGNIWITLFAFVITVVPCKRT